MRHVLVLAGLALPLLAVPTFADCEADIRAVMEKSIASGPYRMDTTSDLLGTTTASVLEMVPPTAMRSRSEGGGMVSQSVFIGERGWMNLDGTWQELPSEMAGTMTDVMSNAGLETLKDMVDEQCSSPSPVDGRSVMTYSFGYKTDELVSTTELLVDAASGLPVEVSNVAVLAGVESRSWSRYTYDADIAIEPPPGF